MSWSSQFRSKSGLLLGIRLDRARQLMHFHIAGGMVVKCFYNLLATVIYLDLKLIYRMQ